MYSWKWGGKFVCRERNGISKKNIVAIISVQNTANAKLTRLCW